NCFLLLQNSAYPPQPQYIPTITEPQVHLGVREFRRQTQSFDDRSGGRDMQRISIDRRTVSDARQKTVQLLQPETSVAAACQSLWAAKGHLEELHALGISDPSSASTSFESNTDNSPATGSGETKSRAEPAHKKRLQYKLPKKSGRRLTLHIPEDETTRRSSSDVSPELRNVFRRRSSQQVDSRRTSSQCTSLGDRRVSVVHDGSPRVSIARDGTRRISAAHENPRRVSIAHDTPRRISAAQDGSRRISMVKDGSQRTSISHDGSRHTSIAYDGPRRESRDFQEFMEDVRRHSGDTHYERERDNDEAIRREMESRWLAEYIRDYYEVVHQRRKWRDMLYNLQNRRLLRELPIRPMLTEELPGRRVSLAGSRPRLEPLYEKQEQQRQDGRQRRHRNTFVRRVALSHDAVFLSRKPEDVDDRSLLLRRKFLSTAAVSSLDSTNSTESSAPDAIFASSVDSATSDLGEHGRMRPYSRQLTANPGSSVIVPYICYPDEVNCSR
ncbi:hypothetical protein GCK32_007613, partial [Trichostrongylus colubriformis]